MYVFKMRRKFLIKKKILAISIKCIRQLLMNWLTTNLRRDNTNSYMSKLKKKDKNP